MNVKIVSVLLLAFLDWFSRKQIYFAAIGGRIAVSSKPQPHLGAGRGRVAKWGTVSRVPSQSTLSDVIAFLIIKSFQGFTYLTKRGEIVEKAVGCRSRPKLRYMYCSSIKHVSCVPPSTPFIKLPTSLKSWRLPHAKRYEGSREKNLCCHWHNLHSHFEIAFSFFCCMTASHSAF